MRPETYSTPGGIGVTRVVSKIPYTRGLNTLLRKLDTQRGVYFSSGYEYPERYARWDFAAVAPSLEIIGAGRDLSFRPLNARGELPPPGVARTAERLKRPKRGAPGPITADHTAEEYMAKVETVREGMRRGDYYEVVLRQTFRAPSSASPSALFERIQQASPSP